MQLHDDLRDSPFSKHAIHLKSYLQGVHGSALLIRAAASIGKSPAQFLGLVDVTGDLELMIEGSIDRLAWDGHQPLVVEGTSQALAVRRGSRSNNSGYDFSGQPVHIPLWDFGHFPIVTVRPVETPFGLDPEGTRAVSPHQPRATIATREEELASLRLTEPNIRPSFLVDCEDWTCDPGNGSTEPPSGYQLPSQYTAGYCLAHFQAVIPPESDLDHDGVRDDCESLFATTFAPQLMYASEDWTSLSLEPWYSVSYRHPNPPNDYLSYVKIFYALGYHRDPGSPAGSIDAHDGDSEFIIVGIHNATGSWWTVDYVTMSAHWGAGSADHTATYGTDVLEWGDAPRGRPRIWVSVGKHANYRSRGVCMSTWNDFCGYEYNYNSFILPVPGSANVGNVWSGTGDGRLLTCNQSLYIGSYPASECGWWNPSAYDPYGSYFGGWHANTGQAKATAYGVMFSAFAF
jgi:hypothetical protein